MAHTRRRYGIITSGTKGKRSSCWASMPLDPLLFDQLKTDGEVEEAFCPPFAAKNQQSRPSLSFDEYGQRSIIVPVEPKFDIVVVKATSHECRLVERLWLASHDE